LTFCPLVSQVDLALESGEYFLSQQQRDQRAREEGAARQIEQKRARTIERAAEFVAPSVRFVSVGAIGFVFWGA
jgi:hypothetical protein